ncbi:MAG: caspase family protein [Deltaproteobacteria bacterium]|nr:caspase family protein [Deltaproteobacteria bacterium]
MTAAAREQRAGEDRTTNGGAGVAVGAGGREGGERARSELRGASFAEGEEALAPGGALTHRFTVDVQPGQAIGGVLLPRVRGAMSFEPPAGKPRSVRKDAGEVIVPSLTGAIQKRVQGLVPGPAAELPAAAALDGAIREAVGAYAAAGVGGYAARPTIEEVTWGLTDPGDAAWAKLEPNMDARRENVVFQAPDGRRVSVAVAATGTLTPADGMKDAGPRVDGAELAGLESWLGVLLNGAASAQLSEGKTGGNYDRERIGQAVWPRLGKTLAPYGLGAATLKLFVTKDGKAYEPEPVNAGRLAADQELATGKGALTVIAAADAKQYAYEGMVEKEGAPDAKEEAPPEAKPEVTPEEVPTLWQRLKKAFGGKKKGDKGGAETEDAKGPVVEYEKRGFFSKRLTELMRANPELSLTECAALLIDGDQLDQKQHAEMFALPGTDAEVDADKDEAGATALGKKRALVVGCHRYVRASWLPGAENDAASMNAVLTARGYEVEHLVDPGFTAFHGAMKALHDGAAAGDQVVIYFAGHGTPPGYPAGEGLLLADGKVFHHASTTTWIASLRAQGVAVELVLDCCHSGQSPDLVADGLVDQAHLMELSTHQAFLMELRGELERIHALARAHYLGATKGKGSVAVGRDSQVRADGKTVSWDAHHDPEIEAQVRAELTQWSALYEERLGRPLVTPSELAPDAKSPLRPLFFASSWAEQRAERAFLASIDAVRAEQKKA